MLLLLDEIHRYLGTTFLHIGIVIGVQLSPATSPSTKTSSPHPENGQLKQPTLPLLQARVAE
jgi:hypothetical protein